MKTSCIFSIFAFFAVSIGMHAQDSKTYIFWRSNDHMNNILAILSIYLILVLWNLF